MNQYSLDIQKYYIQFLLSSNNIFARCQNIVDPVYFDSELKPIVKYIKEYSDKNSVVPLCEEVNSMFKSSFTKLNDLSIQHEEGFLQLFEQFCRHKAMENAITSAPEKLKKSNYSDIEREMREALLITLQKDLGTEYFEDPRGRLDRMRNRNATISTGWRDVDKKLYGGLNRGEITIFAGNSGMGKSLFLQNLALNWSAMGLFVVYISFELSEELVSMRLDAMLNKIATKDVFKNIDEIETRMAIHRKDHGPIQVKYMNSGSSANDLKAYLKELEIKTGRRPDALCVDYLDLMYPNNKKINPSDLFIKDKFVTEELRSVAVEYNSLCATASQLGRSAIEEQDHDQSHIAGGISKINTSDNTITIYSSTAMRERGEYRLQFIKTRSSSGVGSKVMLSFDPVSLRIFDAPDNMDLETMPDSPSTSALKMKARMNQEKPVANAINTENNVKKTEITSKVSSIMKSLDLGD